ncbi:MAG TPA: hypothetical protein VGG03_06985 [Thermoanaerobaculia bacterium]
MHDDWQVAGSQLNSKTPQAQLRWHRRRAARQQLELWASTMPSIPVSATASFPAGVTGAARKLRAESHPELSIGGASAAIAKAGAMGR